MFKKYFFIYFVAVSIPAFLGLVVWQTIRYKNISDEISRLERAQTEWVAGNRRLIAEIAEDSSPEKIEEIAVNQLGLQKIKPEHLLQVKVTGRGED